MFNLLATVPVKNLSYTYDATGQKLRKQAGTTITEYISGIQYNGKSIDFIQTEEGRAINSGGSYTYEYMLSDHLGNTRSSGRFGCRTIIMMSLGISCNALTA